MKDTYAIFTQTKKDFIKFNGKDLEITLNITAHHDHDYDSSMDEGDVHQKIMDGLYTPVVIEVLASFQGIEGADALGGVIIARDADIINTVQEYDMEFNARADLENALNSVLKALA